jgi:hypothetical protein
MSLMRFADSDNIWFLAKILGMCTNPYGLCPRTRFSKLAKMDVCTSGQAEEMMVESLGLIRKIAFGIILSRFVN